MALSMSIDEVYALINYNALTLANATARGVNPPPADGMASHLRHLDDLVAQVAAITVPPAVPADAPPIEGEAIGH